MRETVEKLERVGVESLEDLERFLAKLDALPVEALGWR